MKIAFIIALEEEIDINKKQWKLKSIKNNRYYSCNVNNNKFFLIFIIFYQY